METKENCQKIESTNFNEKRLFLMIKSLKVILIIANINNPTSNLFENLNI
jgi:hypothetical protein